MVTITRLGNILKKLRNSRNLNMISLASAAHIGIGTIGDIERGKNSSKESTLEKISLALNLSKEERLELYSGILPEDVGIKLITKDEVIIDKFIEKCLQDISSSNEVSTLVNKINSLPPSEKEAVKSFIEILLKNI